MAETQIAKRAPESQSAHPIFLQAVDRATAKFNLVGKATAFDFRKVLRICECLAEGATRTEALNYVGLERVTFFRWLEVSPDFKSLVTRAEFIGRECRKERSEELILQSIKNGCITDAKWHLERTSNDYGRPMQQQHNRAQIQINFEPAKGAGNGQNSVVFEANAA